MATRKGRGRREETPPDGPIPSVSSTPEELMLAALEGGGGYETGRFLYTLPPDGTAEEGRRFLEERGLKVAVIRDTDGGAVSLEEFSGQDAIIFEEIGVGLVGAEGAQEMPAEMLEPERFVFGPPDFSMYPMGDTGQAAEACSGEHLRSAARILEAIAREVGGSRQPLFEMEEEPLVLGDTWGLIACKVPPSTRNGAGIRVAVLDTGVDMGHPDFAGRLPVGQTATFVGQPIQDLSSHGTHCIGTACGPKAPPGNTPRYGIGYQTSIFVGKVLTNSGFSTDGSVLRGMNWAVANRCEVISMSLGGGGGPYSAYTAAGQAALNNGCLMIAAAGNHGGATSAPANSPTIMAVASLDRNLNPSTFSGRGKIEIAAPGENVFSAVPRPRLYGTKSGTSMATPHVAGCAALWAQTSPNIRGRALWQTLQATARRLPHPPSRVGAGLVQAPA